MSERDLHDALSETGPESSAGLAALEGASVQPVTTSPTVLQQDRWSRGHGEHLAQEWAAQEVGEFDPAVVGDAHQALFDPSPELCESPADEARATWFQQMMETPEYQRLHGSTCLNVAMSDIASAAICREWSDYAQAQAEQEAERQQQPGDGSGEQPAPGSADESIADQLARMRSTAQALAQAADDVQGARDTAAGLGLGEGSELDQRALAEYFRRIRGDQFLARVMQMAGRMTRRAQGLQQSKTRAKYGGIVGVELGGDLSRLIPAEMMQITGAVPELQERALYRLLRKRSVMWQREVAEPAAAGPIVVCVDESGSMSGERIIAAKALALAMAWIARQQGRWIALVGFSSGETGHAAAWPAGRMDTEELIAWMQHFFSGGTTLDVPLGTVPGNYWSQFQGAGMPAGKTDMIIITDAQVRCPAELLESYRAWCTTEAVNTYGIILGAQAGDLADVCNHHWTIPNLDLDSDAVTACLSI